MVCGSHCSANICRGPDEENQSQMASDKLNDTLLFVRMWWSKRVDEEMELDTFYFQREMARERG